MVRKLIDSLLQRAAYPEPTQSVTLTETHVSFLFLTDRYVYKIKKPVDFGFLDFTTLPQRLFYCREELRLNRRLCPDIYLEVVELRETPEGPAFEAPGGELLDYAVKMKRLPEERMLIHLLARGEVGAGEMQAIARVMARFHARAATGAQIDACATPEAIGAVWEENFRQAAPFCGETLSTADLDLLRARVTSFLAENVGLFQSRIEGGFIREGDGDLHLGNICLDDRIHIFDCIEFNERFRYLDTAADIAFLLMDLEYAGHPELSPPFLDAYRGESGDPVPEALLDFYRCQRAFVRGKVQSFRLSEPGLPPGERDLLAAAAGRYFRLARGFALRGRLAPSLILTCGMMGSGKSTLAKELSFQLGLARLSSDLVRKGIAGRDGADGAPAEYGGGIYGTAFNEATYLALLQEAELTLSRGKGVLVDATFRRREDRAVFREAARRQRVPFFLLETRCPETLIKERLEKRRLDPDEPSDGRWELFARHKREFQEPEAGEAILVDGSLPVCAAADQALRGMGLLP